MVNKVILVGRLVADPELSYSGRGVAYTKFTLAINTGYGNMKELILSMLLVLEQPQKIMHNI